MGLIYVMIIFTKLFKSGTNVYAYVETVDIV